MLTIGVVYTCRACGIREATVQILPRAKDQDVVDWMNGAVRPALGVDHRRRSPFCRATSIDEVRIPLPASQGRIGDPTKH